MKRILRRLFNGTVTVSLLLCVAAILLFLRSECVCDSVLWQPDSGTACYIESARGHFYYVSGTLTPPSKLPAVGWKTDGGLHFDAPDYYGTSVLGVFTDDYARDLGASMWDYEMVRVPYSLVVAGLAICPGIALCPRLVRVLMRAFEPRYKIGICHVCGYDLRATPNRCPECGTVPAKADHSK